MVGLKSPRVLLVDNEFEEAAPILAALAAESVPAIWYTGDFDQLPAPNEAFRHIRLALLDMDLVGGGVGNEQIISTLVQVVRRLIAPSTAGLKVVLWTKHPELRRGFIDALIRAGGPLPIVVVTLDKNTLLGRRGKVELDALKEALELPPEMSSAWQHLLEWEEQARDAAGDVVSILAEGALTEIAAIADSGDHARWAADVDQSLGQLLLSVAREELGEENVKATTSLLDGVFRVAAPLHNDLLEARLAHVITRELGSELYDRSDPPNMSAKAKALINTKLGLSGPGLTGWTGAVYDLTGSLEEYFKAVYPYEDLRSSWSDLSGNPSEVEKGRFVAQISKFFAVDLVPACDHAQKKLLSINCVAGICLPYETKVKKADFVWSFGPLLNPAGAIYQIVIDLRRTFTCPKAIESDHRPIFRLRSEIVGEIISKVSGYGTRKGKFCLK